MHSKGDGKLETQPSKWRGMWFKHAPPLSIQNEGSHEVHNILSQGAHPMRVVCEIQK
jgi:hypothetical protein